jgi:hypothetical protein
MGRQIRMVPSNWEHPQERGKVAAWDGISREKPLAGIARLGPGPGATDVYRAMIEAGKV